MDYKQYIEEEALAITETWELYNKFHYDPHQNNILQNNILEKYIIS